MNLSEIIKKVSRELGISGTELARRSGQSPQNLSKKLVKGTLSFEEFENLMGLMGVRTELDYQLPDGSGTASVTDERHVTEQLDILEKQLEVEKLKNRYYAEVSYEFRTALETIDGGVSLAASNIAQAEKALAYLKKIQPAIRTLTGLVSDNPFNRETGTGPQPEERSSRDKPREEAHRLSGKNVLLVEDNELNRDIVRELLEEQGARVFGASNGQEAVEAAKTSGQAFDFILTDIYMPVLDGFEATRRIRALGDKRKAAVKIVAMTASVTEEDRRKAEASGMDGFMEKPLDLKKLENIVCEG